MNRLFLLWLIILIPLTSMGQKRKHTLDELNALDSDSIIKLAESYITGKNFNRETFDIVTIKKNKIGEELKFYVTFKPSVLYLSIRHLWYSSVTVDLLSGSLSNSIESRCRNYRSEANYYKNTRQAKRAFRIISKAATKNDQQFETGNKNRIITIHERLLYYQVQINTPSSYGFFRVHKITRSVYKKGHKHKIQNPEN